MTAIAWKGPVNGDWSNAADWAGGVVPGATDDVTIASSGATVTVSVAGEIANSLTTTLSVLSITAGSLETLSFATMNGAFQQSGGLWKAYGSGILFSGGVSQTGGTLSVQQGMLVSNSAFAEAGGLTQIYGGAQFTGPLTITKGEVDLRGGNMSVGGSLSISGSGTLALESGTATLSGTTVQTGGLINQTGGYLVTTGSFTENGGTMSLAGGAEFKGTLALQSGTITTLGGAIISEQSFSQSGGLLYLNGGGTDVFYGNAVQTGGTFSLHYGSLLSYGSFTENGGVLNLGFGGGTFDGSLTELAGTITSTAPQLLVNGAFSQSAGVLQFLGADAIFTNSFKQAVGGTIGVLSGALELEGQHDSLAGTISGAGTLLVAAGTTTLQSGVVLSLPAVEVTGGRLVFASSSTLTSNFAAYSNGAVSLGGNTLTLTGYATLGGEFGRAGKIIANGGGVLNQLSLDGTMVLDLNSAFRETGNVSLGQETGSRTNLQISKKGSLSVAGNYRVSDSSSYAQITNAGLLAKTGGATTAYIQASTSSTGTISVATGTLDFSGRTSAFGGAITGGGTISFSSGELSFKQGLALTIGRVLLSNGAEQLTLTKSIAYGGEWDQLGGSLWLDGPKVVLSLTGIVGLDGGLITGSGTIAAAAGSHINIANADIEGVAVLDVKGTVEQTASVGLGAQIGSASSVIIEQGAVWNLENNGSLGGRAGSPSNSNGTIVNAGVLEKLNGSADSSVVGTLLSTGTITVGDSSLSLYGSGSIGGVVSGAGMLNLNGDFVLAAGLQIGVGQLAIGNQTGIAATVTLAGNMSDANIWSQDSGALVLNGSKLSLSGLTSLDGGTLTGAGTMSSSGATTLGGGFSVVQGAVLLLTGQDEQAGTINIGDFGAGSQPASTATVQVGAGASYVFDDDVSITGNGTLAVASASGSLAAGVVSLNGGGLATIGASVVDNGTILANSAQLTFIGPITGTGTISVAAGGSLDFSRGAVASSVTVAFAAGSASMFLEDTVPNTNTLGFNGLIAGFGSGDIIELSTLQANVSNGSMSLNANGTILTVSDKSGDTATLQFATPQNLGSLVLGLGAHGDLAVFHT